MNTQLCWAVAGELGRLDILKADDSEVVLIGDLLAVRCVYSGKATSNANKQVLKCIADNRHRIAVIVHFCVIHGRLYSRRQAAHVGRVIDATIQI